MIKNNFEMIVSIVVILLCGFVVGFMVGDHLATQKHVETIREHQTRSGTLTGDQVQDKRLDIHYQELRKLSDRIHKLEAKGK